MRSRSPWCRRCQCRHQPGSAIHWMPKPVPPTQPEPTVSPWVERNQRGEQTPKEM